MTPCHKCSTTPATWDLDVHMALCVACTANLEDWRRTHPGQPARRWETRFTNWDEIDRRTERRTA